VARIVAYSGPISILTTMKLIQSNLNLINAQLTCYNTSFHKLRFEIRFMIANVKIEPL
jgi:hypothetical protein